MKPILFNAKMVRAILEGRKTVTRRIVKPQPPEGYIFAGVLTDTTGNHDRKNVGKVAFTDLDYKDAHYFKQPYQAGEILYVRETWWKGDLFDCNGTFIEQGITLYKADEPNIPSWGTEDYIYKWKPSIHMPREAARIFLKVTDVKVERLQQITEEDIYREGIAKRQPKRPYYDFGMLWNSTLKGDKKLLYEYAENPWVWVIEFERINEHKLD